MTCWLMDLLGKTEPNRYLIGQELLARIALQEKNSNINQTKSGHAKISRRKPPASNTNWKDKIFIRPFMGYQSIFLSCHNSVLRVSISLNREKNVFIFTLFKAYESN